MVIDYCGVHAGDLAKDIRYMADLVLANAKYLIKHIVQEELLPDNLHLKYISSELWTQLSEEEDHPATKSFYEADLSLLSLERGEPEKVSKTFKSQTNPKSAPVSSEPVSQEEPMTIRIRNSGKSGGKKGIQQQQEDIVDSMEIEQPVVIQRSQSIVVTTEWGQSCLEIYKKITKHEFVDITKIPRNGSALGIGWTVNFYDPFVIQDPSIANAYLAVVRYDNLTLQFTYL